MYRIEYEAEVIGHGVLENSVTHDGELTSEGAAAAVIAHVRALRLPDDPYVFVLNVLVFLNDADRPIAYLNDGVLTLV